MYLNGISVAMYFFTIEYSIIAGTCIYVLEWDIRCYVYFFYRVFNYCWNYVLEWDIR